VGRYEQKYQTMLASGSTSKDALDALNMTRYCCRRIFLTHIDVVDKLILFPKDIASDFEKKLEIK
jgi:DNA-directed RNA polymerase I, II, and III subunit RPABC5